MKQVLAGLMLIALMSVFGFARAVPVTYTLTEFAAGANKLNGSITVDDTGTIGQITQTEITAWSFTATGNPAFSTSGVLWSCNDGLGGFCFTVSGSDLIFDFASVINVNAGGPRAQFLDTGGAVLFVNAADYGASGGDLAWAAAGGTTRDAPAPSVVIGTHTGAAVDAPGSVSLVGIALAAWLGASGRRARRRKASAV